MSTASPTKVTPHPPEGVPVSARLQRIWHEELGGLSLSARIATFWVRLIPDGVGGRLRTLIYRASGMQVGPGSILVGALTLGSAPGSLRRLRFGSRCFVNGQVYIDAAATVTIGSRVSIGHHVVIITTDHALGPAHHRAGTLNCAPVTIHDGAWIAAGVTILPGVTIGSGAVVAAGAVVAKDVPPNTLVGGVPARVIRHLEGDEPGADRSASSG